MKSDRTASLADTVRSPSAPAETKPDYADLVTVSAEHYLLGRELARGGMGRILLARDRRLGRAVALKQIVATGGDANRRFEREARITARLQHPSIVNVHEAGVWPSGEPFYAMALVAGRSLSEVIDQAKNPEERLALLPTVLAVADALAYAHGERIIHRDLKPGNVLVGAFGETVVIDWGLAKDLESPEAASAPPGEEPGTDPLMTSAGAVMGTPAYMPREQAEGRPVDERADVYAIGAILHHLLAGQPPYPQASSLEVLAAVRAGPPVPLAERQPDVPDDLQAIVARAMAREPAGRYLTARELAEDLRRYQTGQLVRAHHYPLSQLLRRWLQRHRAAVSVAVVGLTVLLVMGAMALRQIVTAEHLAEEQRALATASRGEAEDLLGFMLVDLRDKLAPVGRLDLLDHVAKKAVAYYQRKGEHLSDAELAKRSLARRNLGDVLSAQGHSDEALHEYQAALNIAQTLAANDPAELGRQKELSDGHDKVGDVLFSRGATPEALAEYQAALVIREALAAKNPGNAPQRALSVSHDNLGDVLLAQGLAARALAEYRASLAIALALAAQDPANADRQRDLSVSHDNVGDLLFGEGVLPEALVEYQASLVLREALAAAAPANTVRQRDLSVSHEKVGDVLLGEGDATKALGHYQASLALRERLTAQDPTNADSLRDLSVSHDKVGRGHFVQGDLARALAEYRASAALDERLAAQDPMNAVRMRDLSISHDRVGEVLLARQDWAGALAEFQASLTIAQTLAANDPTNAGRQVDLSISQEKVGDVLLTQHATAAALTRYREALAIREALSTKDPSSATSRLALSVIQERTGAAFLAQGQPQQALAHFREAMAGRAALAAKDPANAMAQLEVAKSQTLVGDALLARGDRGAAVEEYRAALALAQRLQRQAPGEKSFSQVAEVLAAKVMKAGK